MPLIHFMRRYLEKRHRTENMAGCVYFICRNHCLYLGNEECHLGSLSILQFSQRWPYQVCIHRLDCRFLPLQQLHSTGHHINQAPTSDSFHERSYFEKVKRCLMVSHTNSLSCSHTVWAFNAQIETPKSDQKQK